MKALGEFEVWFLTGSQDLYGEETLRQVADHSGSDRGRRSTARSRSRSGSCSSRS